MGAKSGIDFEAQLSELLDESEDLDLLSDMMIQPATPHFQHPRQPQQNYGHASMNSYRQGYHAHHHQVRNWERLSINFILNQNTDQKSCKSHYFQNWTIKLLTFYDWKV